ncbi:MAG TPA: hypothetical protein O0W90_00855, partial [Methanocorpusculum sp.]|nr:hypothetical protein [Methanocorpusculum sp.]
MKRDFCNRYEKLPFKAILLSMLIIFVCASAFCGCVSAEDVTVSDWNELKTNLENKDVTNVKLADGFTNESTTNTSLDSKGRVVGDIDKAIYPVGTKILDLNGVNLTCPCKDSFRLNTRDVKLTIVGPGNVSSNYNNTFALSAGTLNIESGVIIESGRYCNNSMIRVAGNETSKEDVGYSTLNIKEGAVITSNLNPCLINIVPSNDTLKSSAGVVVNIDGTLKSTNRFTITVHGNIKAIDGNVPEINVGQHAVLESKSGEGVYGAGYGIWTFNDGCKVTGNDSLSIKSGKWIINGGTYIATGNYYEPAKAYGNGAEPTGSAVSITDKSGYARNVTVTINGGKFTSVNSYAVFEGQNSASVSKSALGDNGITINGGEFSTKNASHYPIKIANLNTKSVHVTLNDQTPFYPGLNTSAATWVNNSEGNWNVTLNGNIENVESIDLTHVPKEKIVTVNKGSYNFVKVSKDDKYSFDGWNDGNSKFSNDKTEFAGGVKYTPIFTYIKQYDTGEEVEEEEEPTPTAEPTPIVTPTPTQNQTVKPTVKPTPEPKTVVIVENEVKFEDNKVITSITVPEGSSGSITFTQTEEKGMDEWIPESIEDSYSFDLSCDGEING